MTLRAASRTAVTMDCGSRSRRTLGRNDGVRVLRAPFAAIAALLALVAFAAPGRAAEPVKIGIGYGLAFLPAYICEDLKLVEKYGRAQRLDLRASYQRFAGAGAIEEALDSGTIDMGPFGVAPLLMAWDSAKNAKSAHDARRQMFAVSGLTTLPLALVSNQPGVHSLGDLRPSDRIAMP